jgi:excinuclease UvrABC helicase subunit UvrB
VKKSMADIMSAPSITPPDIRRELELEPMAADPVVSYMTPEALRESIAETKRHMEAAAKELDFLTAAKYRDEMFSLEKVLAEKEGTASQAAEPKPERQQRKRRI